MVLALACPRPLVRRHDLVHLHTHRLNKVLLQRVAVGHHQPCHAPVQAVRRVNRGLLLLLVVVVVVVVVVVGRLHASCSRCSCCAGPVAMPVVVCMVRQQHQQHEVEITDSA